MNYENVNINSYEYTKLSNEEKLELVRSMIKKILNEKADKHQLTVVYNGKKFKINKDKQGKLRDLASRERSLEKKVKEKERQESLKKVALETKEKDNTISKACDLNKDTFVLDNNNEGKTNALIDNYREIALDTHYYKNLSVKDKIKEINREKESHKALIDDGIYLDDEESKEYFKFLDDLLVKLNVEAISNKINTQNDIIDGTDEENIQEDIIDSTDEENIQEEIIDGTDEENIQKDIIDGTDEEKKSKGILSVLMGLPLISKIKNRKRSKDSLWSKKFNKKKKRIATAICAGIIFVTSIVGLKSCNNNKDNNNNINTTITDIDDSKEKDPIVDTKDEDIKTEEETVSLNDTVTIDNGAPIYTNSYDASYNTNGYNALYDGSYDRIIEAVSYELDGKVYTVYRNEDNSYEKVDELIKNGATLTSVLVTRVDLANDITHEGYYNVSNVRVRSR